MFVKKKLSCLTGFFFFFIGSTFASETSSQTKQTIIGHEPTYIDNGAEDKLGFEFDGIYINKVKGNDNKWRYTGPLNSLLSHVMVQHIDDSDVKFFDDDGDHLDAKLITSDYTLKIFDNENKEILLDPLNNKTACDLNIIKAVVGATYKPETVFGDPKEGKSSNVSREYLFDSSVCKALIDYSQIKIALALGSGLKDNLIDNGFPIVDPKGNKGNFPTTGFPKAAFRLQAKGAASSDKPLGNASKWVFSIENDKQLDFATVSSNGTVVFDGPDAFDTAKIAQNLPITVTVKATTQLHFQNFNYQFVIKRWFALPASKEVVKDPDEAKAICKALPGNYRLPKVLDIVNSEDAKSPPYQFLETGDERKYVYAIGEGLLAEWGNLFTRSNKFPMAYDNTGFSGKIWTSELSERNESPIFIDPNEYGRLRDKALFGLPLKGTPICVSQ